MTDSYFEHIVDAREICSNCHRKNRMERVDPVMSRSGLRHELDSHYSRDERRTTVEYHDSDPEPTHAKGVFCECGVEGTHHRLWNPTEVDRESFKDLLQNTVRSLEERGVSIKRKEMVAVALSHFDDHGDVDKALATGTDAGIVAATAGQ